MKHVPQVEDYNSSCIREKKNNNIAVTHLTERRVSEPDVQVEEMP